MSKSVSPFRYFNSSSDVIRLVVMMIVATLSKPQMFRRALSE